MKTHQRLMETAEIFQRHHCAVSADLAREMAKDSLAMETHFPGADLYANWAAELSERAANLERHMEIVGSPATAQQAAGHR